MKTVKSSLSLVLVVSASLGVTQIAGAAQATDNWTGNSSALWNVAANWSGGNSPPLAGDMLVFNSSPVSTLNNNFPDGTAFDGLTFNGGTAFVINGGGVLLSGASGTGTLGIFNNSGAVQSFGTMKLTLDEGYYVFSSPNGGSIGLNAGLAVNNGGIPYFDGNVTSTALTLDSSGLISGLGGAGLMYNGITFTGLATVSGGLVSSYNYSGPNTIASGVIPSGAANNIQLTATPSSGTTNIYTLAGGTGNTFASTILSVNPGASTGTAVVLVTNTGTLVLGTNNGGVGPYIGGIYAPSISAGSGLSLNISGGKITAGPMAGTATPGELVLGVNGTTLNNQLEINSTIQDNASGGAVSVTAIGNGSMFFNIANTYSGGTFVDQGQVQVNNVNAFGTGPVFVAPGATVYLNTGSSAPANNFSISPGTGASFVSSAGSLKLSTSAQTIAGRITLLGAPAPVDGNGVATGPGDRITAEATSLNDTFTGQITGPGTLECYAAHSDNWILANTSTNTNNFQGGILIDEPSGVGVDLKLGAANQIPFGPNAGNLTLNTPATTRQARFDLNGFNATINGLIAPGNNTNDQIGNFGTAPSTLTLGANNVTAYFGGASTDNASTNNLSIVKIGTGTQTFGGPLNHHGSTTVSAGTMQLNGSASGTLNLTTNIFIASGANLDFSQIGNMTFGPAQNITGIGTILGSPTINGGIAPFLGTIGTLNINGNLTLDGGSTYVWDINNATSPAGSDPGSSLLAITNGNLTISATSATPVTIKITSLVGDVPGAAANFNNTASNSWTLVRSGSAISGFDPTFFHLDASAFANPLGSGSFSIGLDPGQTSLILTFTSLAAITTPLVSQTNAAGSTAVFTVTANGLGSPTTFQWQQGTTILNDGDNTPSGAVVHIVTSGKTSTLTLAGVQDSDAVGYSVTASDTSGGSGLSSATLTVVDPPTSPAIAQSPATIASAGGVAYLSATANGSAPFFTYQWLLNGQPVTGATNAIYAVDVSPGTVGNYSIIISNLAGTVTSSALALAPVTSVPNQMIYEPFSSYTAQSGPTTGSDTWENMTNLFNEITGEPAWWYHSSGSGIGMNVIVNQLNDGTHNVNGGSYPWPGLAGSSPNCLYWTESVNNHLEFKQSGGFNPGQSVYVSFIMSCDGLGSANGVTDVLAGFVSPNDGTAFNWRLCSKTTDAGNGLYTLGVSKGNGRTGAQSVDANTVWEPNPITNDSDVLIVGCYTLVSGGTTATDDTVSLWVNPSPSTFYATNAPTPDLGPLSFGVSNSVIRDFGLHSTSAPSQHRIADVRIGLTWASVTPPSTPTITLSNVFSQTGAAAVFASQNAGNPATSYVWQFKGGAPLTDNGHYFGTGTATLIISNVQSADLGSYTVTAGNQDPLTSSNLTGSASATLSFQSLVRPTLGIAASAPNVILSWPASASGYRLEQTASLSPTNWSAIAPPYSVVGTNNVVTNTATGTKFYRLITP